MKYDTSVLRDRPCKVKVVTLRYDTSSLKVKNSFYNESEVYDCSFELKWPIFKNCGNAQIDSSLNSLIKPIVGDRLRHSPKEYCCIKNRGGKFSTNLNFARFNEKFLSFCFYFFYSSINSTSQHYDYINYDFNKQTIVGIWDLFKSKYKKETIKKRIRKLTGFKENKSIGIEGGCLLNFKDEIVIKNCGGPVLYDKLTIQKEDFKKFLKDDYYWR